MFSFIKVQRWPTISLSFIFNYWNWSLVNDYPSVAMASVRTLKSFNYLTVTLDKLNSFRHLTVDLLPNSRNEYIEFMLSIPISLFEYVRFCRLTPYFEFRTPCKILFNSWSFIEQSSRWIFKMCMSALELFSINLPRAIEYPRLKILPWNFRELLLIHLNNGWGRSPRDSQSRKN